MSISAPVTVVGYDGSPPSDRALEHAIAHIGAGSLYIVHAWEPPRMLRGAAVYPVVAAASLECAQRLMEELPARHPRLAEVAWVGHLAEAPPVEAIGDAVRATGAAQIVVGTHGYARLRSVVGSTAHGLLHDAPCPVTVVPERAPVAAAA
jgi:nucleotide-binding universal stress UspA family protein